VTLDFNVRPADPSDAEALTRLAEAVSAEPEGWLISGNGEWRSVGDERRYLKALRKYPNAAVLVAEQSDGAIIGRLSLARDTHPASAHVADLGVMVAKAARGRGVGRGLLDAGVEWARAAGIRKLELHVFPWNEPAIQLYERYGFEREGYRRAHYHRAGKDVDAMLMAYHLGPGREL
jgi:L-phenylalanine/L-methionine N-acetyltransferase